MQDFDAVVVGGGPAGAVAARIAAETGARVLLLEARATIEEPTACAGLVSPRTLSILGASAACVVRRPRDVALHTPDGTTLAVSTTTERALVIDRSILENELLERARAAGVDVRLGAEATAWEDGVVRFVGPAGADSARGGVLVGADGPESRVATWAGLGRVASLRAAQVETEAEGREPEDDVVRVFVGRTVAPGFFAWSVPAQPGRLRIGLAVRDDADPTSCLHELLARHFPRHRVIVQVKGRIPLPSSEPTTARDVLLVGDAAGHVKPLSGGGLYFGGLCARLAGRAAARAADPGARASELARYERLCRSLLGPETRFGAAARAVRDALEDADWKDVLKILDHRELLAVAAEKADLDHLRNMVSHLVAHPRTWRSLVALWSFVAARSPSGTAGSGIAGPNDAPL